VHSLRGDFSWCSVAVEVRRDSRIPVAAVLSPRAVSVPHEPSWPKGADYRGHGTDVLPKLEGGWAVFTSDLTALQELLGPDESGALSAHPDWTLYLDRPPRPRIGVGWPARVCTSAAREQMQLDDALDLLRRLVGDSERGVRSQR
jgi:hypothetical protein